VYVRATTFHAHPSFIDVGITHISDVVMPALTDMPGSAGMSLIVDRDSGRCIASSSWEDEDSLRAGEAEAIGLRQRAAAIMHSEVTVTRWELGALHRAHRSARGAGVRVTWLKAPPAHIEALIDEYKLTTMHALRELPDFASTSLLVDRATARAVSSTVFDTMDALRRNREETAIASMAGIADVGAQVTDTGEFELAIAHLHAPEMALSSGRRTLTS
jgi:heme-degrading monooxygenase HmoA